MLPTKVRLEACTLCQLNCKDCYMRLGNNCHRGAGYLKFEDFAAFLELNPYIKEIELSNSGEIFLNPDLGKIMEHAFNKGVTLGAYNGVNFNSVSPKILEDMVKYHFYGFAASIDGWNQETYVQYRRNGNFDNVIANLKLLNQFKAKYDAWWPCMSWKYIIFAHNDNVEGSEKARALAKELGMDFFFFRDWGGYEPKNIKLGDPSKSVFKKWNLPCIQLWESPQINWDGHFLGCLVNEYPIFGNESLFEVPLAEFLERDEVKNVKQMLMGKKYPPGLSPACDICFAFREMKQDGRFISEEEILNGGRVIDPLVCFGK